MPAIVNSGATYIAQKQGNSQPVDITEFVLANITGLDPADPVDLNEVLPAAGDIVGEYNVTQSGYVASDKVVYSLVLDSTVGDFDFNWIGLKASDGTLVAVSYIPTVQKRKTNGGNRGDNVTRNFMLQFADAQNSTGISIDAETWQIDLTARLSGIDERERAANEDTYGRQAFFNSGFLVVNNAGTYHLTAGRGLVAGLRLEESANTVFVPGVLPKDIWLDVSLAGDITGKEVEFAVVANNSAQADYVDGAGNQHYLEKIGTISSGGGVTDLRTVIDESNLLALIDRKATTGNDGRIELATQTEMNAKADTSRVPSVNVVATFIGAEIQAAIDALIGGAPAALDTLKEISDSLSADNDFAATMANSLAQKVNLSNKASKTDSESGTSDTKWTTPLNVHQALNYFGLGVNFDESVQVVSDLSDPNIPSGMWYYGGTASDKPTNHASGGGALLVIREWSGNGGQAAYIAFDRAGLIFRRSISDGVSGSWLDLYHTGNKPTPADIGAISKDGDVVDGDLEVDGILRLKREGGDAMLYFWDATAEEYRVFRWDDSLEDWRIEVAGGSTVRLFHEAHPPTPEEVGALPSGDYGLGVFTKDYLAVPYSAAADSNTDWNNLVEPGWWKSILGSGNPNNPGGGSGFWYCLVLRHLSSSYITQLAVSYGSASAFHEIKMRTRHNGTWSSWTGFWSSKNHGPNSGLDADMVDGVHLSSLVRGDGVNNGSQSIHVADGSFVINADTGGQTFVIWYDGSSGKLRLGGDNTPIELRGSIFAGSGDKVIDEPTGRVYDEGDRVYSPNNPPTPAQLGYSSSKTVNGYEISPEGVIRQWGEVSVAGNSTKTVTLPTPFPNAGLNSKASYVGNSSGFEDPCTSTRPGTTSLTVTNGQDVTQTISWEAIGH